MDFQYDQLLAGAEQPVVAHLIPYAILIANYFLFALLRSLANKLLADYSCNASQQQSHATSDKRATLSSTDSGKPAVSATRKRTVKLVKLFVDELISTCELCADCAELNVVYERQGALAYGLALFMLSYLWIEAFGEAHTTPGYLVEDLLLDGGKQVLRTGSTYARFVGQSLALPLAWRFASFYWKYNLLSEHKQMLAVEDCKSALNTSTLNGFLVEFGCCLLCRLVELIGHRLLDRRHLSQRLVSLASSFICTVLVVLALELSGGYFNPVLAASLEYGCRGIQLHQHATVFWLGPLLGHVVARALFRSLGGARPIIKVTAQVREPANRRAPVRSASQRRKQRCE